MKFLKVTTTTIYAYEEGSINGWSDEEVVKDWFKDHDPQRHHATRDAHRIGGTTLLKDAEIISEDDWEEYRKELDRQNKEIPKKKDHPRPFRMSY